MLFDIFSVTLYFFEKDNMKKLIILFLTSIFPFSVFAQDTETNESEENPPIYGCMHPKSSNYNPNATIDDLTCLPIVGCADSTALNYDVDVNIHSEAMCKYAPPYTPQNIEGAFEKSQVSIGATTWTLRFNLNVTGATLDSSTIQTWNRFTAVSATANEKTLTLTLRQFDDQRLDVECTNYEVTIPRRAILTPQGDTNANPITGNFEVLGCEKKPDPQPQENSENTENVKNDEAVNNTLENSSETVNATENVFEKNSENNQKDADIDNGTEELKVDTDNFSGISEEFPREEVKTDVNKSDKEKKDDNNDGTSVKEEKKENYKRKRNY